MEFEYKNCIHSVLIVKFSNTSSFSPKMGKNGQNCKLKKIVVICKMRLFKNVSKHCGIWGTTDAF